MTLYQRYIQKDNEALINVLENPEDFSKECYEVVLEIFNDRVIDREEVHALAYQANVQKAKTKLENQDLTEQEMTIHKSYLLEEETVRQIYKAQLEKLMSEKNGFRFDVWQYALGGI